jgi:hypothetical protein
MRDAPRYSHGVVSTLSGSCLCGAVQFEVTEPFVTLSFCHCTNCKRISGGVGTASGRVPTSAIHVLSGEDALRTYQPAEGTAKTFCSVCGSNLFGGGWPESEFASVRLATIDSPFEQRPEAHIYVRSLAAWETLPDDGLPRFEVRGS